MNSPQSSKLQPAELRQSIRLLRRQLSQSEQQQHSELIIQQILQASFYKEAQHIALYLPADGEVDLSAMIAQIFKDEKNVYLPIILSAQDSIMYFAGYEQGDLLENNCFGILEPYYHEDKLIAVEQLDLILAPLVAFDEQGNRMGMGGGYYDRFMQPLKGGTDGSRFIGIAHELQKVERLNPREWDIPLDVIITEQRLTYFS